MVKIDIDYLGDLRCGAAHVPSGNTLITDAPVDNQGRGEYFSPTDLVATALGTCLATIMGIVAEREGIDLSGLKVHIEKEMVSQPRRRIGSLKAKVVLAHELTPEQKAKLENAARSCPVRESLHPDIDVPIEFVYP